MRQISPYGTDQSRPGIFIGLELRQGLKDNLSQEQELLTTCVFSENVGYTKDCIAKSVLEKR